MSHNRCKACGQWAGKGHLCPTVGLAPDPVLAEYRPIDAGERTNVRDMVNSRVARAVALLTRHPHPPKGRPKMPPAMTRDSAEFAEFERRHLNGGSMSETKAGMMATELHRGQTDQLGVPYIEHPMAVTRLMQTTPQYLALSPEERTAARIAAVLHDTLEDTALEEGDLRRAGCSELEIATIRAVTARDGEPKKDYYARIVAAGPVAVAVKIGDLTHNNLPERRENLPGSPSNPVKDGEEDRYARLGRKYWIAYTSLGADVPEHLQQFAPEESVSPSAAQ